MNPIKDYSYTHAWNLFLLTLGPALFSLGINTLATPHGFIHGGLFGAALLLDYGFSGPSAGVLFFLLNLPLFVWGWYKVGRRFFFYTLYATAAFSFFAETLNYTIDVKDQLYAAILCGVLCGAGAGVVFKSLGSGGGLDIVAVYLNQKYNIGIGRFYVWFNAVLFCIAGLILDIDLIIASFITVFITSVIMDHVLSMFSQRKIVMVISENTEQIARDLTQSMGFGATFLQGRGAYSGQERPVLLTIINNIMLKRLEELVFTCDPNAIFIVENTFNVIGSSFNKRKIY